jgi:hypothetical protein
LNANNNAAGALAFACICVSVVLVVVLALYIFFCLTLHRTMKEVRPRNRTMPAGLVWLHMVHLGGWIPILGIVIGIAACVWDLIMVLKIASSLKNEFEDREWRADSEGFGRPVGLIWTVIALAVTPLSLGLNLLGQQLNDPSIMLPIALVLIVLGLTSFVCWIIYWVQMASYGRRLRERHGGYRGYERGSVEEDYDDDYRPQRHRDDEYDREDRGDRGRVRDEAVDDEPFNFDRPTQRPRDDDDDDRPRRREREDY